jgi:hypothetical protein
MGMHVADPVAPAPPGWYWSDDELETLEELAAAGVSAGRSPTASAAAINQ